MLVDHGVPFDLAFQLDDATRAAFTIIFGELQGYVFNWSTMTWKPPPT